MISTKNLRVVVTSHALDGPGGIVNYVGALIRHMPADVSLEHLPVGRNPKQNSLFRDIVFPIVDNVRLHRIVKRQAPQCVQINTSLGINSLIRDGALLLTLRAMRYRQVLLFFHGWDSNLAARIVRSRIFSKIFRAIFGQPASIIVLASSFKNTLTSLGVPAKHVQVFTTMFEEELFSGASRNRDGDDETRLVFMSRFVREKGVYESLAAFARLAKEMPGLRLVLAGDGPERENLAEQVRRAKLSERVEFTGYIRASAKAQVLVDGDIFVFPTYYGEGCPVALLEAMAAGLPIVTHRAGGIPDFFVDGSNGVLLNEVNSESVTQALVRLLSDSERMKQIGEHNRQIAWEQFGSTAAVGRMQEAYAALQKIPPR